MNVTTRKVLPRQIMTRARGAYKGPSLAPSKNEVTFEGFTMLTKASMVTAPCKSLHWRSALLSEVDVCSAIGNGWPYFTAALDPFPPHRVRPSAQRLPTCAQSTNKAFLRTFRALCSVAPVCSPPGPVKLSVLGEPVAHCDTFTLRAFSRRFCPKPFKYKEERKRSNISPSVQ